MSVKEYIRREVEYTTDRGGQIIICVSGNHIARLDSLWEIACETGNKLVIPVYSACLLRRLQETGRFHDPKSVVNNLNKLWIYERSSDELYRKMDGVIREIGHYTGQDMSVEHTALPDPYQILPLNNIRKQGPGTMIVLWQGDIKYLPQIKLPVFSKFIHSTWEAFNEELEIEQNILQNWVKAYEMTYHHIHVSGHVYGLQLKEIVSQIAPRVLVPVHTMHPEMFLDIPNVGQVRILRDGDKMDV